MPVIEQIKGMVNTVDPVRAEPGQLRSALNVDIDDSESAVIRPGQTAFGSFGAISSAYATRDMERLFVIDAGALKSVMPDGSARTLESGLDAGETWWCEAGNHVFYSGANQGAILNGEPFEWGVPSAPQPAVTVMPGALPAGRYLVAVAFVDDSGRYGGCSHAVYVEPTAPASLQVTVPVPAGYAAAFYISTINNDQLYLAGFSTDGAFNWDGPQELLGYALPSEYVGAKPPPAGQQIAHFNGRIHVAVHVPEDDVTHIFASQPFFYHLFDLARDSIAVPGQVVMLAETPTALIIGTDREIFAYTGEVMETIADYGMIAGHAHALLEDKTIVFWTKRGLCRALPFQNLTEKNYSFQPGDRAAVQFLQHNGYSKAVVVTRDGGEAFNKYQSG